MADEDILDVTDLNQILRPTTLDGSKGVSTGENEAWPQSLKVAERELILRTLRNVQGNRTRAAELLGISLRGLHYKLKSLRDEGFTTSSTESAEDD
jgi:DNA-binding NtrC family response regulator